VKRGRFALSITVLMLIFLYLPLVVITVNSFNVARFGGEWRGFTLKWYALLLSDRTIWHAFLNTMIVALSSTAVSMIIGTVAALSLHRYRTRFQSAHRLLLYAPLVVPDVLIGMSLLLFFFSAGFRLGLLTVFAAHVTFSISYVAMVVLGRLQDFDNSVYEAARDMGADWFTAMRKVVIPIIAPGIIAGGVMAFTLSIDDFVITFFVSGEGYNTLPVYIYSMQKHGFPAVINALSVLFILLTFVIVIFSRRFFLDKDIGR
jgi:spermidine/putrescine transport system permease protein